MIYTACVDINLSEPCGFGALPCETFILLQPLTSSLHLNLQCVLLICETIIVSAACDSFCYFILVLEIETPTQKQAAPAKVGLMCIQLDKINI